MTAVPCVDCGGSRHRFDEARLAYVPCHCLRDARLAQRRRAAGLPPRFEGETWKGFLALYRIETSKRELLAAIEALRAGNADAPWLVVCGRPARARRLAATLILRAACEGGLAARLLDVPTMIDVEFEPGRGSSLYGIRALAIECGEEPENKWNRHVLEKAVRRRWLEEQFTMLVTVLDPSRLPSRYKNSGELAEAIAEKFADVRVSPREGG